jgi:hypothetical protein
LIKHNEVSTGVHLPLFIIFLIRYAAFIFFRRALVWHLLSFCHYSTFLRRMQNYFHIFCLLFL